MPNENQYPLPFDDVMSTEDLPSVDEDYFDCPNCGNHTHNNDAIEHDNENHCCDCVLHCENCDRTALIDDDEIQSTYTSTSYRRANRSTAMLCSECSFECADCNERFSHDIDHRENASGERICESCSENYYSCDDCGCVLHGDDTRSTEDGETYCESCYADHQEEDDTASIHSYSYKPEAMFYQAVNETSANLFLGWELEVDHSRSRDRSEDIESIDMPDCIYCKEDGSLDLGFEMVSHPGTFKYWQSLDTSFIRDLKRKGYKSYDTDTCGMHIHVSRKALTTLDLFKVLEFFRRNVSFVKYVSRRKERLLDRWASVETGGVKQLVQKVKRGRNSHDERYTAINLENRSTIEFRIFRGTLNPESFKRNLAFIFSLVHFVKATGLQNLSVLDYVKWLESDGKHIVGKPESKALCAWVQAYANNDEQDD